MRFRTYDELTPSMEVDRSLLHLAAFNGVFARRSVDIWRRRAKAFAEYVGLFAEERGRLVGQMFVLRIALTLPSGRETVTGIAGVGTRPDRGGTGVARRLLTEAHHREKEAGIRVLDPMDEPVVGGASAVREAGIPGRLLLAVGGPCPARSVAPEAPWGLTPAGARTSPIWRSSMRSRPRDASGSSGSRTATFRPGWPPAIWIPPTTSWWSVVGDAFRGTRTWRSRSPA